MKQPAGFTSLSDEVLRRVFTYCDEKACLTLQRVCRRWRALQLPCASVSFATSFGERGQQQLASFLGWVHRKRETLNSITLHTRSPAAALAVLNTHAALQEFSLTLLDRSDDFHILINCLTRLPAIRRLQLSSPATSYPIQIPSSTFRSSTSLQHLLTSTTCTFTGPLDGLALSLAGLQTLHLTVRGGQCIQWLSSLAHLERLQLHNTDKHAVHSGLSSCLVPLHKLVSLGLADFCKVPVLGLQSALQHIQLSNMKAMTLMLTAKAQCSGIDQLVEPVDGSANIMGSGACSPMAGSTVTGFPHMTLLHLEDMPFASFRPHLPAMPGLQTLHLAKMTSFSTMELSEAVTGLPLLRNLIIDSSMNVHLHIDMLKRLPALRLLQLQKCSRLRLHGRLSELCSARPGLTIDLVGSKLDNMGCILH